MDGKLVKLEFSIYRPVADQRARVIVMREGGGPMFEFGILGDADQILLSAGNGGGLETFIRQPAPATINVWYDFEMVLDLGGPEMTQIQSASFSIGGGAATQMINAPVPFWYPSSKMAALQLFTYNGADINQPNTSADWAWDRVRMTTVGGATPGDFDSDGDVDGADFVAWQTNFPKASGATLDQGDADADGDVDGADFVVWQTNFPFSPGGGVAPVPEPGAIVSLLIGGALALTCWPRLRRMST
jgi:hypothetical protein